MKQDKSVFSGVMLSYLVLILHILLMIGLGAAVILIKGIYDFRWFISIAGIVLVGGSGYYFYHRIKKDALKIRDLMRDPALQNSALEISLLGGMATLKLGHTNDNIKLIQVDNGTQVKQLEAPKSIRIKELSELTRMLDKGLVTHEEFLHLKKDII